MTALEQLTAADPARDRAPTREEAERMDAQMARLLADEAPPGEVRESGSGRARRTARGRARQAPLGARPRSPPPRSTPRSRSARPTTVRASSCPRPRPPPPPSPTSRARSPPRPRRPAATPTRRRLSYVSHMRPKPGGKGTFVVVLPHEDEQWVADDGTGVVRDVIHDDQPTFPTPEDKADYEAATAGPPFRDRAARGRGHDRRRACRRPRCGRCPPTRRSCAPASRAAT